MRQSTVDVVKGKANEAAGTLKQKAGRATNNPRLEDEGTTFARLVDDVRRRRAVSMVRDRSLSLGEIAFLLGFSEASAFHRAFRRWTGGTPRP